MAIVTGGTRGPGREIVLEITSHGCAVAFVYLRDPAAAEAVVERVSRTGGSALAVRADLTDALDVERLFEETISAFGVVDVVVHAARAEPRELLEQAAQRLRRDGAVVIVSGRRVVTPALVEALRSSGMTVFELSHRRASRCQHHMVMQLVEVLRPWLETRAG